MATDITTLAIALQSKEAESNLKIFNELLATGSTNAKKMERMTIGVDVDAALQQLNALRTSYEEIAKTAQNIHFDMGITPEMFAPKAEPSVDASALEELKAFFQDQAEAVRKQAELVSDAMEKMGAGAERAGGSVRTAGESMRGAGAATGEYAEKLKELNAAKKEMEKIDAKNDADAMAAMEAFDKAAEAKQRLANAEQELARATEIYKKAQVSGTRSFQMSDLEYYESLPKKIEELKREYEIAQAEAEKFGKKLDISSAKAEEARKKIEQLKAELAGIPAPAGKAGVAVDTFGKNAKQAGTTVTKLARGFNAVAFAGGATIPGLSKLGMAISMFAYSGPYVGAAVVGIGLLATAIKNIREQTELDAQTIHENAERALKSAQAVKQFISESEKDWNRLGELSSATELSNVQNQEATAIIQRLTETYGYLGIEIDKTTGKLKGYAEARAWASKEDAALQHSELEFSASNAQAYYEKVIEEFKKNAGQIYSIFGARMDEARIDYFQDSADNLIKMLSDNIVGENVKIDEFRRIISDAQSIIKGDKTVEYLDTSWEKESLGALKIYLNVSKKEATEYIKQVEKVKEAYTAARDAKKALEKFDTQGVEQYAQEAGKIAAKIAEAEKKFTQGDAGNLQLKTADETYQDQKNRIAAIEAERAEVEKKAAENERAILDNGKQAGIYLKELELERLNLIEKTLTYEQRIAAEKERERKSINSAIDAEQMRLNTLQLGYKIGKDGELIRKKTEEELELDRIDNLAAVKERIAELEGKGANNQTLEDLKALTSARLELANLQAEQIAYEKRVSDEIEKQAEAERKKVETAKEHLKTISAAYTIDKTSGALREKNADEKANDRLDEIADLKEQIKSLSGTAARRDATPEELAQWGGRYNPATGKMDGAQKQSGWRGLLSDGKGGFMTAVSRGKEINGKEVEFPLIVPDSTEEELVKIARIAHGEFVDERDIMAIEEKALSFAKKRLAEGKSPFFNGDAADEALRNVNANSEAFAQLAEAQTRLVQLQSEQSHYAESLKAAQQANADARKGYVFDDKGAVLRRKTEEELRREQAEEIEAARKRVAETQSGTQERLNAEAELTRLEIEAYNMRKKSNTAAMLNEARTNNSRMVQGIEARSAAAMALQARTFRRDESETAILKDTKDVNTDIRSIVQNIFTSANDFRAMFSDINNKLQSV